MDISVIIVNYNVKYFLEQCLHSIQKSSKNLDIEVFVVDNNSVDGSCRMVSEKFPTVKLIENRINTGFAKANNQAIEKAKGKYILIINPDTVIEEHTLIKCFDFMEKHPDAGCMGVKMIDGKGNFLPESKRALPTPSVAFYKIFGLSKLFPKSKIFGRYHLGYMNKEEIHEIEVVSGAFMFIRKEVIDKTGSFDEQFFMYGEDIDLSYRIIKAGYKNYYYPGTTIIHYKGESTKKGSINYVIVFYNAMVIFVNKHFSNTNARLFSFFINTAIYLRAGISIFRRFYLNSINPALNALAIFLAYCLITPYWEHHIFGEGGKYPEAYLNVIVPVYIVVWLISLYISGAYERNTKFGQLIKGTLFGSVFILLIYSLLPENLRFSRALILFGTIWVLISTFCIRYLLSRIDKTNFKFEIFKKTRKILIIGDLKESKRVYNLLKQTHIKPELIGIVSPDNEKNPEFAGNLSQIEEIVRINKVEEVIFCSKSISSQSIISTMLRMPGADLDFKIAPPESLTVIGSNSINTAGDLYVLSFNTITKSLNLRKKRLFDIIFSFIFLISTPVLYFILKNPGRAFLNLLNVFIGKLSFVGYYSTKKTDSKLPEIKKGVLTPLDALDRELKDETLAEKVNMIYAKDYRMINDMNILVKGFFDLGRKVLNEY